MAMYHYLFSAFVKCWRSFLSNGDRVLWIVMSKEAEQVCLLHILAAAATQTIEWETEKGQSVLPTGICNLCCWIERWLCGKRVNELRMNRHQPLAQAHVLEHVVVLRLLRYWENSAAKRSVAGTRCKDWGAPWDPAAEQHSLSWSFFQCWSNCWLEYPQDEHVCGQSLLGYCWRIQQCPGRLFLSSLCTVGSIIWHNSLHACTFLTPAFVTFFFFSSTCIL